MPFFRRFILLPLCFLGACASQQMPNLGGAAIDAASQPFEDLGLIRPEIHPSFERVSAAYAPPLGPGCAWLNYELFTLSAVLGEDQNSAPLPPPNPDGQDEVRAAAENMVRSVGRGIVPGRSIIRHLTGANARDRLADQTRERAGLRRAYLTGLSRSQNCLPSQ